MADHNKPDIDHITGTATTGHEWDGIKELNTPLPKWWVNIFYATIVWAVAYWVVYPAWPLISSHTTGFFGYTSRAAVQEELDALKARRAAGAARIATASLEQIVRDPALLSYAMAQGKAAFGDNCAPCHGLSATGSRGFPNLRDDDWIWGGSLDAIRQTITHGIRSGDARGRDGSMMAFGGTNAILKPQEIQVTAEFVRSLAGLPVSQGANLAQGRELYTANCASCHGDQGRGNMEVGAPNLTDAIWLYGSDLASIVETITNGRGGVMPPWNTRLDEATIKTLTVYVHSLGGGK